MHISKTASGYTLIYQVNPRNNSQFKKRELCIQAFIIDQHFKSTEACVLVRKPGEKKIATPTYLQIFKDNLSSATYDQWQNTAGFLIFLITGSYGIYKITSFVRNFLKQRYKEYGSFWSLTIFLGWGGFAAICYKLYARSIFYIETKPFYIQHIVKEESSMKSSGCLPENLGNVKDDNGFFLECISEDPIDNIYSPKIIVIGNLAFRVENILKAIFRHPLSNTTIKHPFYNYNMPSDQQSKLVKDITTFFCISKEDFMRCWDIELEKREVPASINKDDLFTLARLIRFLELLPNGIIKERLTSILLDDRRSLATYLSQERLLLELQGYIFLEF